MLALVQRKQFCSDVVVNCHLNQPLFCILFLDFFFFCLVGFKLSLRLSWLRHIALIERPRIEISTLASWWTQFNIRNSKSFGGRSLLVLHIYLALAYVNVQSWKFNKVRLQLDYLITQYRNPTFRGWEVFLKRPKRKLLVVVFVHFGKELSFSLF